MNERFKKGHYVRDVRIVKDFKNSFFLLHRRLDNYTAKKSLIKILNSFEQVKHRHRIDAISTQL